MRKITILLMFLFFIGTIGAYAQTRTISGKVTSAEDGQGIPGVSVFVKGTTVGTVTDLNGEFALDVEPTHTTLVFQYVGMETQEMEIGQTSRFDITLSADAILMEEVVVTALGISREKKSLGYAVQELDGESFSEMKDANFVNGLSGKSAGVDILQANTMGGSANVLVRGVTSLTQNNQALFVVDGVPYNNRNTNEDRPVANSTSTNQNDGWGGYDYGNNAMDINPDDIESISVLKGAAATALYGSRAANGVILITTKKGKTAAAGKKHLGITWSGGVHWTMADLSTAPQWQDEYGGGYGPFYDNEGGEGVLPNYFFVGPNGELITPTSEDASWGHPFDPNLQIVQWDALDPLQDNYMETRPWVAGENGLDYWFRTGMKWTNNIAFDGANDNGSFRFSYANLSQNGIVANSRFDKHNLAFQGSYNFTDKLTIETNVSYVNMWAYGRYGTGYDGLNPMQSLGQWFERNVDLKRLEEGWLRPNGQQLSWNSSYYDDLHPIYFDNPYWVRNKNFEDDGRDRFFGYVLGKYDFTDDLSFTARFSGDIYSTYQNERIAVGSVDPSYYSNFNQNFQEYNTELMLRYNKSWDKMSLSAMLGSNFRQNTWQTILGQTVGGLVVPELYSVSNSVSPARVTETDIHSAVNSLFGQVSFGLMNFLYIDLTGRNDWSSTLKSPIKEDPNENISFFYPSASLSLVLSEMNGVNDVSWLSLLKLRGNYAEVGNDAPAYATMSTYSQNTSWGDLALFSVNSTMQNPDLVPERTKGWEIGLETRFFNNRVGLDYAFYKSNSYDQILPVLVSPFTGVSRIWVNGGQIENTGHEISLYTTPVQTKNWRWDLNVNWWKNKNKVIELYQGVDNLLIYSAWDVSVNATVGQPYGTIRGTDFIYTNGEKTVDENGYYQKTENDTVIGNIQPDWKMGIPTTLSFKGVSLYMLIDIQKGGDIYSINTKYGEATGLYANTVGTNPLGNPQRSNLVSKTEGDLGPHYNGGLPLSDADPTSGGYILPGVKEDGNANDILVNAGRWGRAFYYNNSPTARYVFDASYVKLRELSLSYALSSKTLENTILRQVRFSLVGRNLWIIHKNVDNFDPEASLGSGNQQGIETGSYPALRSFGFNLTLGF